MNLPNGNRHCADRRKQKTRACGARAVEMAADPVDLIEAGAVFAARAPVRT